MNIKKDNFLCCFYNPCTFGLDVFDYERTTAATAIAITTYVCMYISKQTNKKSVLNFECSVRNCC